MDQLHLLWEYQKADVEVDKMEASIKRSPTRQKLLKYREYVMEQQAALKHIETEVANMADRLEALKDAIRMTDEQLHSLQAKMDNDPPANAEASRAISPPMSRRSAESARTPATGNASSTT